MPDMATEMGGAVRATADHAARPRGQRLIVAAPGCAQVTLYPPSLARPGGPHHVVKNASGGPLAIKLHGGATLTTVADGASADLTVGPGGAWGATGRAAPPRSALTNYFLGASAYPAATDVPENPDCPGGNPCTLAAETVPHPVPMWINPVEAALNSGRDAIRGADLTMARRYELTFGAGLTKDPAHDHAGALSSELLAVLRRAHVVTWDGAAPAPGTSRHPHHAEHLPASVPDWEYNANGGGAPVDVKRLFWEKEVPYVAGGADRTLVIRMIAEWSVDEDGDPTADHGAYGTLVHVVAYSDEVNPGYSDGDPDPAREGASFDRDEPLVWGPLIASPHQKVAHPQALVVGNVATTFQAPFQYSHWLVGGDQRRACHRLANGAPWSSGADIEGCCAFQSENSGAWKAMTVGGDVPTSELFPLITLENGAATGVTAMRPENPGWDEAAGDLTGSGSDVVLTDCPVDQSANAVSECEGHPDAPYYAIGGTHRCFKTGLDPGYCCFTLTSEGGGNMQADWFVKCQRNWYEQNGDCEGGEGDCESTILYHTQYLLHLEDYDFDERTVAWRRWAPDPDYQRTEHSSPTLPSGADVDQDAGTFGVTSTRWTVTATAGGTPGGLTACMSWKHAFSLCNGTVSARVYPAAGVVHAVGMRCSQPFAWVEGYFATYDADDQKLRLVRWKVGARTVLAEIDAPIDAASMVLTLTATGTRFTAKVERHDGTGDVTCTAEDCDTWATGGFVTVGSDGGAAGAKFEEFAVSDRNDTSYTSGALLYVTGNWAPTSVGVAADAKLVAPYPRGVNGELAEGCGPLSTPDCGPGAGCPSPCEQFSIPTGVPQVAFSIPNGVTGHGWPTGEEPPEIKACIDDPSPDTCFAGAGCPPCDIPYILGTVTMPTRCDADSGRGQDAICASGSSWYVPGCITIEGPP